ncbi:thiopurine S-methyltransferase [Pseudomonas sp. DTU_2021_1001937_2_SI_NGA_ILE_001]|uniref:thiopurine S-methyltransferase n=1 Tax=Pseudomonas sp. DTU_2021_1001937_2_SI_NGA_ILE_001 TaxID=3077589 RepID=UPI0028FC10CD|nr:thiopurine S-methyltransferase [Pseudomonas sp. DTU_2021_1001937_2_SI_NGA_ILE_001]WNW13836.1 thiopurine S-methyltransferase [Pseudomonas sp. DTU_2021_1001937_2_SI_NGA_ILE_001]
MEPEFWHHRWAIEQIGFHQPLPSAHLQRYWPALGLLPASRVLVPLCGKSLDMTWLVEQGYQVVGVELSDKAVLGYFAERQVEPVVSRRGAFDVYEGGGCQLWCGDFFELTPELLGPLHALYDRAAMVALPPAMRERYVAVLDRLLASSCRGLLVALDYPQEQLEGPPFAVSAQEVGQLARWGWEVSLLESLDDLPNNAKARQAGATHFNEQVYRLQR